MDPSQDDVTSPWQQQPVKSAFRQVRRANGGGASFRFTASLAIRRTLHRAMPCGGESHYWSENGTLHPKLVGCRVAQIVLLLLVDLGLPLLCLGFLERFMVVTLHHTGQIGIYFEVPGELLKHHQLREVILADWAEQPVLHPLCICHDLT
jgi:hypothetical protein